MDKTNQSVVIRLASLHDAEILYSWDAKPHIMAAVSNSGATSFDANWEEELAERTDGTVFFVAEVEGAPIGVTQIIDPQKEQSHYWGAIGSNLRAIDIWIGEEDYLGQGFGTAMMTHAIEHCFDVPEVKAILIDPLFNNKEAHRFYKRFGFEFVERRQFDIESDCYVFKLARENWQPAKEGGRAV